MTRVVLVPGTLALLPEYASGSDPVAALRAACRSAVGWLGAEVEVVADEQGRRVAEALLAERADVQPVPERCWLVVANGSAKRTERAPGHLDPRAEDFDARLGEALRWADTAALRSLDQDLATELWAATTTLPRLADLLEGARTVGVDLDDAPYGVQYWVARWVA